MSVNGRPVPIAPISRAGELLVFLLEQDGLASLELIADTLRGHEPVDRTRARQSIWKLVNTLRVALGWEGSVISLKGAYQLDPQAEWHYDVREARAQGVFEGEFLSGVYSEWALEVGRALEELRAPGAARDLN